MTSEGAAVSTPSGIVVGVDGSPASTAAIRWAVRDARLRGRVITLVHVLPTPERAEYADLPIGEAGTAVREKRGRELLDEVCALITGRADEPVKVETCLITGTTVQTLVDLSAEADLVVVGRRGRGTVASLLLGSVSQGLLHRARCPVVVVHGDKPPADDAPVVLGVDGSQISEAATAAAFDEASWRGVELVVVHACGDDDAEIPGVRWADLDTLGAEVLAEQLAGWSQRYPEVRVRAVVVRTSPARWIIEQADHAQLVVVGSRGRGTLAGVFSGSVSNAVVQAARVPVMVIRP